MASAIQAKYGDTEPLPGMAFGAPRHHSLSKKHNMPPRFSSLHKSKSQGESGKKGRSEGRDVDSLKRSISMDHYGPRFDMGVSQLGFAESP